MAYLGYDLGVIIDGATTTANIDNFEVSDDATGDEIPPLVQRQSPADNATTVAKSATLILVFHEDIFTGSGNITIKKSADDSTVETVPAGSVGLSGRTATITPSSAFEPDTEYYVLMDAGVFQDGVANESLAITSKTAWNFKTTMDDASAILWQDSFETPTVSGSKKKTAPDNWLRDTVNGNSGLANTDTGTFSTPYGAQAASVWNASAFLTLDEGVLASDKEALVADQEYRVTFNVADGTDVSGAYEVSLMAFTNGAVRTDGVDGIVLTNVTGTAISLDMGQEADGFSYTAASTNAYLGQLLGLRIKGAGALVDNLTFSWTPPPPAGTVITIK